MYLDYSAMWVAAKATSITFPGERISYSWISDTTFFNTVFVLVTGLEAGLIGGAAGLIIDRKKQRNKRM